MKKIALAALLVPFLFCSCVSPYTYKNSSSYEAGNATISGIVKSIDIDWKAGDITIQKAERNSVRIEETASNTISDAMKVHYLYDEDDKSLMIKFCKSKTTPKADYTKNLVISLPNDTVLEEFICEDAAGNIKILSVPCKTCEIETAAAAMDLNLPGTTDYIEVSSSAGAQIITGGYIKEIIAENAAGTFSVTADKIDDLNVDTAAGKVNVNTLVAPCKVAVITTGAGAVTLGMPENDGFKIDFSGVIKDVSGSDFALTKSGDTWKYKDGGSSSYTINTLAGSLTVNKL